MTIAVELLLPIVVALSILEIAAISLISAIPRLVLLLLTRRILRLLLTLGRSLESSAAELR